MIERKIREKTVSHLVCISKKLCLHPFPCFLFLRIGFPPSLDARNFQHNVDVICPEEFQGPPLANQVWEGFSGSSVSQNLLGIGFAPVGDVIRRTRITLRRGDVASACSNSLAPTPQAPGPMHR